MFYLIAGITVTSFFMLLVGWFLRKRRRGKVGEGISLLVPFRDDKTERKANWQWLKQYWEDELPGAQIVIGRDERKHRHHPFSKTQAVNNARKRATGDVLVILDADCYIDGDVILEAADKIRKARTQGYALWFIPYRHLYRLTHAATRRLRASDPAHPLRFPSPPDPSDIEGANPSETSGMGHWFGALIQIMPVEAFDSPGGMDPRFRGWGGEDVSFVRAVDTLYGKHRTLNADVLTLYHTPKGDKYLRMWQGQSETGVNNGLAKRYNSAFGDPLKMRKLTGEY